MSKDTTEKVICPVCNGDGRIPDKSGGGRHGVCKTCLGTGEITDACGDCHEKDDPDNGCDECIYGGAL